MLDIISFIDGKIFESKHPEGVNGQPVTKDDLKKSEERCPICGKSVWDCPGHKGK